MNAELATLAEAEEDIDDEDDEDSDGDECSSDVDSQSPDVCTFDVPHFRYIDDEDEEEDGEEGLRNGSDLAWSSLSNEEDCSDSSSYRYVVVSGTPLKILEHLLSDLRLDDQRGAPESRESGTFVDTTQANSCKYCALGWIRERTRPIKNNRQLHKGLWKMRPFVI